MSYAKHALLLADGSALTTEERLELALRDPGADNALTQAQTKAVTQNRIRSAMAELSHGQIEKVSGWLDRVAEHSPAKAVELFIELAQFNLPRLKAIAVDVRSTDGSVKTLSVSELEKIVSEQ